MFRIFLKSVSAILLIAVLGVLFTAFSPIYRFRKPAPFEGPDIFNPYQDLDTAYCWKRALFHCHTRVKGPLPYNECQYWPLETLNALHKLGYDIVTFSNHNELTRHPLDSTLQVNVYEHGYSPFKFHLLVYGSQKVIHFDPLLPLLASQKQFTIDLLAASSDFIQINHPYRTVGTSKSHMEALSGYKLIELDAGRSTENEYWDWALSAGHYSFGVANDDLHKPDRTHKIGVRCNFLCTPSGRYKDLKRTLLSGNFYAMRVPDYGHGDWKEKYAKNKTLPSILDIGLRSDTIFLKLSAVADSIRVTGQNHSTLALVEHSDSLNYVFRKEDHYARLTAFFPEGEVIYSNPFARYDHTQQNSPFNDALQKINWLLTILYNVLIAGLIYLVLRILYLLLFKRCKCLKHQPN
ncbi:MAG: hypothetical protein IJ786_02655 [Bacteroidaceae bacterium]|nr:hypothetical protein [Bacteroidaceae bacterium]